MSIGTRIDKIINDTIVKCADSLAWLFERLAPFDEAAAERALACAAADVFADWEAGEDVNEPLTAQQREQLRRITSEQHMLDELWNPREHHCLGRDCTNESHMPPSDNPVYQQLQDEYLAAMGEYPDLGADQVLPPTPGQSRPKYDQK